VQHIYTKIGTSTRGAAALFAIEHGILASRPDPRIASAEERLKDRLRPFARLTWTGPDAAPAPTRTQDRARLSDRDPTNQLAGFAALIREVMARAAPVHRILANAAGSDGDAVSLLAESARQRHEGRHRIARSLAPSRTLRPALRERDTADIIHTLGSPEV
jgi:hypothetical protein